MASKFSYLVFGNCRIPWRYCLKKSFVWCIFRSLMGGWLIQRVSFILLPSTYTSQHGHLTILWDMKSLRQFFGLSLSNGSMTTVTVTIATKVTHGKFSLNTCFTYTKYHFESDTSLCFRGFTHVQEIGNLRIKWQSEILFGYFWLFCG